jgi:inner membrane protein involved in colicin E2 resistance
MKRFSIVLASVCAFASLTTIYGLFFVATNKEQFALLVYLFLLFTICYAIVLISHKEIDKLMSK